MANELMRAAHLKLIYKRRVKALANVIAPMLNPGLILDVGCGNGSMAALLMSMRPDTKVIGLDIHLWPGAVIEVIQYTGDVIPFDDRLFSSVLTVDTLHHAEEAVGLLTECLRVTCGNVVIKDHFYRNPLEHMLLRILDLGGNAAHGIARPGHYFTRTKWTQTLHAVGAVEQCRYERIPNMYPEPLQTIIGQKIQFVAQLVPAIEQQNTL